MAEALLARGLKECPSSGVLLAEDIESASRHAQRRKSVDALAKADGDVHVVLAVARLFAGERKLDKARKWFSRAVALDPDFGDALAAYYATHSIAECAYAFSISVATVSIASWLGLNQRSLHPGEMRSLNEARGIDLHEDLLRVGRRSCA